MLYENKNLDDYDAVILDEAHERTITGDLIIGLMKQILKRRPSLKLIITSATMDNALYCSYFRCPFLEVAGRVYPVKTLYRPYRNHQLYGVLNLIREKVIRKILDDNY